MDCTVQVTAVMCPGGATGALPKYDTERIRKRNSPSRQKITLNWARQLNLMAFGFHK